MLFFEYFKIGCMYLDNIFFNLKGMKWGYVGYHFLYCYINYCILCNEKADEKPSRTVATLSVHVQLYINMCQGVPLESGGDLSLGTQLCHANPYL